MELAIEKTKAYFEQQLHYFEHNKTEFLDQYVPYTSEGANRRKQTEQLLDAYIAAVRSALQDLGKDGAPEFVTIGSEVTVTYLDDGSEDRYKIGFPEDSDPDENSISFLSPLGRQLLMVKKGQNVSIETPGEPMQVKVAEVKLLLDHT